MSNGDVKDRPRVQPDGRWDGYAEPAQLMENTGNLRRNRIELATTTADMRRIVAEGKLAAFIGMGVGHLSDSSFRLRSCFRTRRDWAVLESSRASRETRFPQVFHRLFSGFQQKTFPRKRLRTRASDSIESPA